jgi:uncharacterized membrane protein YidH (DUF202 family)
MLDLLRDPLWQFVGVILTVVTVVVSFLIYWLQQQRKGVTFEVISHTSLLTVREELQGKLQVLYDGEPARSLSVLVVKVWNSGNQPILPVDYERPISFCVGQPARILSADVTELEPASLSINCRTEGNQIALDSVLMNPGDSITIKLLVRDSVNVICPDARIVGVKTIRQAGSSGRAFNFLSGSALVTMVLGFYLFFSNLPKADPRPAWPLSVYVGIGLVVIAYALLLFAIVRFKRIPRRLFVRSK